MKKRTWVLMFALFLLTALPIPAQISDPEGDADIPCIDITSVDVRGDTQNVVVTLRTSMRSYPPEYRVAGVDLGQVRLCPNGTYHFHFDTNGDHDPDVSIITRIDSRGNATTTGPEGSSARVEVASGRIVWIIPVAGLGLHATPTTVAVTSTTDVFVPGKLLVHAMLSDTALSGWQRFTVGAEGSALVDRNGGELVIDDGELSGARITVPVDAVAEPICISADAILDPFPLATETPHKVLSLRPEGISFAVPVLVGLPSRHAEFESIYHTGRDVPSWESLGRRMCDGNLRCGETSTFSLFGLFDDKLCHYSGPDNTTVPECRRLDEWAESVNSESNFPPVLLVHGLQLKLGVVCGKGDYTTWGQMPQQLQADGLDVWELDYDTSPRIEEIAHDVLARAISTIEQVTGTEQATIVAHSMGGLIARSFIQYESGDLAVARLVTLGSPHLGTTLANSCLCESCRDMGYPPFEEPFWLKLANDDLANPKTLVGPVPQYWLLAGQRYWSDGGTCQPEESLLGPYPGGTDGVVTMKSALGWDSDQGVDIYPDRARRIALDHYAHTSLFAYECDTKPLVAPSGPDDIAYQRVLEAVRIRPPSGSRYELVRQPWVSWTEARDNCRAAGGHLAVISSGEENDDVSSLLSGVLGVWLGGTNTSGQWEWVVDEPFDYTNWDLGEPNNATGDEHYLQMWSADYAPERGAKWNDNALVSRHVDGYVCEFGRYRVVHAPKVRWEDARDRCHASGGHLATITSEAENEAVSGLLSGYSVWLGGLQDPYAADYSEPAGGWRWITGEPFGCADCFTRWHSGEPNNVGGREGFLELGGGEAYPMGYWNDNESPSRNVHGYICEYDDLVLGMELAAVVN